jgi:carbonic anhydrase
MFLSQFPPRPFSFLLSRSLQSGF